MLDTVLTTESLVYVGLSFYAAGFLVRDELILRTLVLIGSLFWLAYYFLRPEPVWNSIYAEGVLIGINLVLICTIALERTTFAMNERARTLFGHFNRLTPGQFRKLLRDARWMETPIATDIIKEGRVPDRLYFIDAPQYTIVRGGQSFQAAGPAFAGEVVFLRGGEASASVRVPKGTRVVSWSHEALRKRMERSRGMSNALVARFSEDMAYKVHNSVPVPMVLTR